MSQFASPPSLFSSIPRVRLLGTRGSIPVSGRQYQNHGGNTSCVQVDIGTSSDLLIFDAGTGIRELGQQILEDGCESHIHLFITHTHWDHIQGFPFFAPLYRSGCRISVYGDQGFGGNLESLMRGQWAQEYFPVPWDKLRASIQFHYVGEQPIQIGNAYISRTYTDHPGTTLAYKVELEGRTMVYMPDNEFLKGHTDPAVEPTPESLLPYQSLLAFLKDVDLLFGEGQYSAQEYRSRVGWGHTSLPNACRLAQLAGVRRWILIHHDPGHDDAFLQSHFEDGCQLLKELESPAEFVLGFDGLLEKL